MTTEEALTTHYQRLGVLSPGETVDDRLRDRWVRMRAFGRRIPVKPLLGHQQAFLIHDVHHLVKVTAPAFVRSSSSPRGSLGAGGAVIGFFSGQIV